MITYTPETIDTSHISLSSSLEELVERLAENNHDHWARKRIDKGGVTARSGTTTRRSIPILCRTTSYQNRRRNTIGKQSLKCSKQLSR